MHWLAFQSSSLLTFLILECKAVPQLSPVCLAGAGAGMFSAGAGTSSAISSLFSEGAGAVVGVGAGTSSAGAGMSSAISSLSSNSESIEAEEVSFVG